MAIYTRTGDAGETSLVGGKRVSKADPRVDAFGAIDEANSCVGFALAAASDDLTQTALSFAQQRLSACASMVATPAEQRDANALAVDGADVVFVEEAIDRLEAVAPTLAGFVIPGGSDAASRLQVARSVVRRAERCVVAVGLDDEADRQIVAFLNRLSDLLFAAARASLAADGVAEVPWSHGSPRPEL